MCDAPHHFEILGQRFSFPKSWPGASGLVLSLAIIAATIVLIYQYHLRYPQQSSELIDRIGFYAGRVGDNSRRLPKDEILRIGFWTPSPETGRSLGIVSGAERNAATVPDLMWQTNVTAEKIREFEDLLLQHQVDAFRRYEVVGKGHNLRKAGIWWVCTAKKNFDQNRFYSFYAKFWAPPPGDGIYMEFLKTSSMYVEESEGSESAGGN